ncbi:Cyclin, N-terminal [Dillenia turbinata]|uniref:Cyclin, N-terminal n=1 Tax=Dillenia turbinata TaxID=194707 RepID=A0AAN8UYG5_9MAGN
MQKKMEGSAHTTFSLSSLLCHEDENCLLEEIDEQKGSYVGLNSNDFSENEDDFVDEMLQRETTLGEFTSFLSAEGDFSSSMHTWLKRARHDAVKWILNTRSYFGFGYSTAYLSVTYFDGFLSKRSIDSGKLWAIKLLSVACLSLAAKLNECKIPALSEYHLEDYEFESKVIQKMELLVLETLEWKLFSVTPFAFLHNFLSKLSDQPCPKDLIIKTVDLIIAFLKEIKLINCRSSDIAAAAVLAAYDGKLTRQAIELKMKVFTSISVSQIDPICSCYGQMQQLGMRKQKTPKSVISPSIVSMHSCHTSEVGTKRKLTYTSHEDGSFQKIRR